jgi:hypothetical protein
MFKYKINLSFFCNNIYRPDLNGIPYTKIMYMKIQLNKNKLFSSEMFRNRKNWGEKKVLPFHGRDTGDFHYFKYLIQARTSMRRMSGTFHTELFSVHPLRLSQLVNNRNSNETQISTD